MVNVVENIFDYSRRTTKRIFLEHLSVVFIFSVLTIIVTFPVILDFGTEAAAIECWDPCHMMWRFWWTDFSFENGLDFYHSNYIFYPEGADIGGNLAYFTTFIGFLLIQFVDYITAWNIIWFLGLVFGGYGCYLLAHSFNKNYLSSIIAGVVFTFTTYHLAHSTSHIGLTMIVWLPIFVLFLFKLLEKQSKYYPIAGGIVFLLVSFTHLYYSVFITIFSIIFFAIYVFKQKKVSNKTFITNFLILLIIGLVSPSVLLSISTTSSEIQPRPYFEHVMFSTSLENLILPTPTHTTQIISDNGMIKSFYSFFGQEKYTVQIENYIFLGYSVIFLSALAVIKYRREHTWFWLVICGIFVLISLGPELKIFDDTTGIMMPDKLIYDTIPEWNELRAMARFVVMANLALAMLVSYSVYGLIKNKFSSFKQQLILTGIIGFVILFEFSMIPFPTNTEQIPSVYEEIKNDESKFVVLPTPMGGIGDGQLMSSPKILYHQIYHEKPIYSGFESRVPLETLDKTRTYFFNMFHKYGGSDDIIKQDLATHGLSLFDYFDIKYLTVHKDVGMGTSKTKNIHKLMSEILNEKDPIHEDAKLIVYKIPKPISSEPFVLLGSGWHHFNNCRGEIENIPDCNTRPTLKNSEILIVNPTNSDKLKELNLVLSSVENEKIMIVSMNNEKLDTFDIPITPTRIEIENLILKPGVNVITLDTNQFTTVYYGLTGSEFEDKKALGFGFYVKSISITN